MESRLDRNWLRAERYFARGDLIAAKAVCEGLVRASPDLASAHWMLSRIELENTAFRAATTHALAAANSVGSLPLDKIILVTRQLMNVGEYQLAHQILTELARRLPDDDLTLVDVADQLSLLEDQDQALACLDRATSRGIRDPDLSFLRGNTLKFVGRLADAALAYEDAITQDPAYGQAHWSLAALGDRSDAQRRVDRISRALEQTNAVSPVGAANLQTIELNRSVLGYALFKELDTLEDFAGAWDALSSAMHTRRPFVTHDADAESRLIDLLIETYTPEFLASPESISGSPVPVFIVGMPRSGTTLVERILGNHPDLANCGELNDFRMQFKWSSDYYSRGFLDLEAAKRIPAVDYPVLGCAYLDHTQWRTEKKLWFTDKHPGNFVMSGLIMKALPQARIINLRRDPMDSCFSNLKELFAPQFYGYSYSFAEVATHFHNYSRLMNHMAAVAPDRVLDVHYEDLVRDPESQALRMLEFCGLSAKGRLSDLTANTAALSTASSIQVREAIHERNIGGWRRYAAQLAPLERLLYG